MNNEIVPASPMDRARSLISWVPTARARSAPAAPAGAARPEPAGHDRRRDPCQDQRATSILSRSPVVVLTTTDDSREIQRCYDLGANVYITKPVNYEGFANAIRQLGLFFSVIQVPETA